MILYVNTLIWLGSNIVAKHFRENKRPAYQSEHLGRFRKN